MPAEEQLLRTISAYMRCDLNSFVYGAVASQEAWKLEVVASQVRVNRLSEVWVDLVHL